MGEASNRYAFPELKAYCGAGRAASGKLSRLTETNQAQADAAY